MRMYVDPQLEVQEESASVASLLPTQSAGTHHVNLQDRSGKTLLVHNCAKGLTSTVEELALDANIDVNLADNEGNTALHHAAQAGHTSVVEVLLERFTDLQIDQLNKLGQTALIKAAIQGRVNCAKLLLDSGADPYLRDYGRQFCALEWAEYVGRTECAHMIAHFMLDSASSRPSTSANDTVAVESNVVQRCVGERLSGRRRNATPQSQYHRILPIKKFSDTAGNFRQVACLAAIPLIGGAVNGELPAVVRPRVRSAPPIPTFKITTPQQTYNQLNTNNKNCNTKNRGRGAKSSKNSAASHGRAPLMAAVVAHCRVRPSSSCA